VIKSRQLRWAGHISHIGEGRGAYRIFVGKPKERRLHGGPRFRQEDLQEVGWGAWTEFIWLRIGTGGRLLWMW